MAAAALYVAIALYLGGGPADGKTEGQTAPAGATVDSTAGPSASIPPSGAAITTGPPASASPSAAAPTNGGAVKPKAPAEAPTGFPNASTAGYRNAPGFPGSLTPFHGTIQSGQTYKFYDFAGGTDIPAGVTNVTFIGCRFTSNAVDDATVPVYGDNITFSYSSFEPNVTAGTGSRVVAYRSGYQYAIDQRKAGKLTVDHSDLWGWGNAIQFGWSTQAKPVVVRDSWFHDARDDGGIDHTDAILESYGGPSYMVFDHNTIVAVGNTNGLALQGDGYSNVTVTGNYFSGFGNTVCVGLSGRNNKNVIFTGNTFGTDLKPEWAPLYGWTDGNGNLWRQNKWRVAPGGYSTKTADNGKYWWADGTLSTVDYAR